MSTRRVDRSSAPGSPAGDGPSLAAADDLLEALLVALVLVPGSYPRNRFEGLYRDGAVRRVRRRATMVRSIVGDLLCGVSGERAQIVALRAQPAGRQALVYELPALGLRRTSRLTERELELVRFALARAAWATSSPGRRWRLARGLAALGPARPTLAAELGGILARLLGGWG